MAAYDQANHQRILDYFDEHYYGGGSTDAAELASTRALWDPTFNSGSWVEQYYFDGPMMLLPRFQNWIQTYYPGTKLSISEYSFSSGTNPLVDALTEADVLGIFGRAKPGLREFVDVPLPTAPVAYSFRLFRNYDGAGGQFGDTSVNSTSTDQAQLSVYGALRNSDNALTVIAINKTTSAIQTSLTLANFTFEPNRSRLQLQQREPDANRGRYAGSGSVERTELQFPRVLRDGLRFHAADLCSRGNDHLSVSVIHASDLRPGDHIHRKRRAEIRIRRPPPALSRSAMAATQIGAATLNSSASAAFDTSTLSPGSHSIAATYSGDANFAASTSAPVSIRISAPTKTGTTTSVPSFLDAAGLRSKRDIHRGRRAAVRHRRSHWLHHIP